MLKWQRKHFTQGKTCSHHIQQGVMKMRLKMFQNVYLKQEYSLISHALWRYYLTLPYLTLMKVTELIFGKGKLNIEHINANWIPFLTISYFARALGINNHAFSINQWIAKVVLWRGLRENRVVLRTSLESMKTWNFNTHLHVDHNYNSL